MSDSILPWISDYLIATGEEFGANTSAIPFFTKKKKAQLVEFLTFGSENGDCIWAKISDKQYVIPIRFSDEAIAEYNRISGKRLTQHKTAVISIKDFRTFFARIPRGHGQIGMTADYHFALECGSFSVIGSLGEARWGNPKEIEDNDDIRLWSEGLRQDGGGGNILKNRKGESGNDKAATTKPTRLQQRKILESPSKKDVKKRPHSKDQPSTSKHVDQTHYGVSTIIRPELLKEYQRSWRSVQQDPWKYVRKPENGKEKLLSTPGKDAMAVGPSETDAPATPEPPLKRRRVGSIQHALDLGSQTEIKTPPLRTSDHNSPGSQPFTDWSLTPSVRGSSVDRAIFESPPERDTDQPHAVQAALSNVIDTLSEVPAPTSSAQLKDYAPTPSSPLPSAPAVIPSTASQPIDASPALSAPIRQRRSVIRKVPRPPDPSPLNRTTGPARILAPNSDTSGTTSQSLLQSQSQSQPYSDPRSVILPSLPIPPVTPEYKQQSWGEQDFADVSEHHSLFSSPQHSPSNGHENDRFLSTQSAAENASLLPKTSTSMPVNDEDEDIVNASTVAQYGKSQELASNGEGDDNSGNKSKGKLPSGSLEMDEYQPTNGGKHADEDHPVIQHLAGNELDEDDAQIEEQLFGSRPDQPSRAARANGHITDLSLHVGKGNEEVSLSPSLQHHSRSHSLPRPESRSSLQGSRIGNTTDSRPSAIEANLPSIEHDAEAWKTPSFLRPLNIDSSATRHTKDSSPEEGQFMPLSHSSTAKQGPKSPNETKNSSGKTDRDDVQDKGKNNHTLPDSQDQPRFHTPNVAHTSPAVSSDRPPQTNNQTNDLSTERLTKDSVTPGQSPSPKTSRLTKRARPLPDTDIPGLQNEVTKRRKLESSPPRTSKKQFRNDPKSPVLTSEGSFRVSIDVPAKRKLAGFVVNFNNIPRNNSEVPWLSWSKLKDILLRTGRSQRF